MKKNHLNKVFTSLLVCMLTVTAFALKGCKDESEDNVGNCTTDWLVADQISNVIGILYSDDNIGLSAWVIVSDSTIKVSNDSLLEVPIVYTIYKQALSDELNEMFQNFIGKKVVLSCAYLDVDNPDHSLVTFYDIVGSKYHQRMMFNVGLEVSLYDSRSINSEKT